MRIRCDVPRPSAPARPAEMPAIVGAAEPSLAKGPAGRQIRPQPQPGPVLARTVRVLLADDSPVVREGLARLLQLEPDIEVVGQAGDGLEALQKALHLEPDVVIMDVTMPVLNGIEATRCIHEALPNVRVLGLSMYNEQEIATAMTVAGAVGYLTKTAPPSSLIAAIREGRTRDDL